MPNQGVYLKRQLTTNDSEIIIIKDDVKPSLKKLFVNHYLYLIMNHKTVFVTTTGLDILH